MVRVCYIKVTYITVGILDSCLVTQTLRCLNTELCRVCSFSHNLHGSFLGAKQSASLCAVNIKYGFLQCLMLPLSSMIRILLHLRRLLKAQQHKGLSATYTGFTVFSPAFSETGGSDASSKAARRPLA